VDDLFLGVELGFALFTAERDGFPVFVFAGDAGVCWLSTDGALVSRCGQSCGCEREDEDDERNRPCTMR
jgi:hypothetical protein